MQAEKLCKALEGRDAEHERRVEQLRTEHRVEVERLEGLLEEVSQGRVSKAWPRGGPQRDEAQSLCAFLKGAGRRARAVCVGQLRAEHRVQVERLKGQRRSLAGVEWALEVRDAQRVRHTGHSR